MLATLLLFAAAAGGSVAKGYLALTDKVDRSTFICIGRVVEIVKVPAPAELHSPNEELPIARVEVERVFKGDRSRSVIHHEAWSTWKCDTTSAEVGERALFLLAPGVLEGRARNVRQSTYAAIGADVVLRNVGSGDGIVDIEGEGEGARVHCPGAPYVLSDGDHAQRIDDLLRYITDLETFSLDAAIVHARSGWPMMSTKAVDAFDLRVLPDGRARLAKNLGAGELVSMFHVDRWEQLHRDLDLLVADQRRTVGDATSVPLVRELALRSDGGTLTFAEPSLWFPPGESSEGRRAAEDALKAWALLRAAIDCPECRDDTARDRARLAGR